MKSVVTTNFTTSQNLATLIVVTTDTNAFFPRKCPNIVVDEQMSMDIKFSRGHLKLTGPLNVLGFDAQNFNQLSCSRPLTQTIPTF